MDKNAFGKLINLAHSRTGFVLAAAAVLVGGPTAYVGLSLMYLSASTQIPMGLGLVGFLLGLLGTTVGGLGVFMFLEHLFPTTNLD